MATPYNHRTIEKKWQEFWDSNQSFKTDDAAANRRYVLDMFPYPSSFGLHVGHPEGYTATDIISRYFRTQGISVLHPMGWDAFGLPAENFAIKSGRHPREVTNENIDNFRRQLKSLGFSYDWSREISTADPAYYRWTQWLFLQLYQRGLAYRKEAAVNWCPSCQTVLANEQVIDGACERCGSTVTQRSMKQWFFKITQYADELLLGFDELDWSKAVVDMQKKWIGRSEGHVVRFSLENVPGQEDGKHWVDVFTTRLDTIFGATFIVVSPERAKFWMDVGWQAPDEVRAYVSAGLGKQERERIGTKEKTGVATGLRAVNPLSGEAIPLWVADYVLGNYGTGAIMAVPAHDERDLLFARQFSLPVRQVITDGSSTSLPFVGEGELVASGEFTGQVSADARHSIAEHIGAINRTNFKLRDWLVSRQRYWGAPIPIIICPSCGDVPVPEADLPVLLPDDVDFRPTGESPLARSVSFHDVRCPTCAEPARRESDTMDTFVDSSWYFLRYTDPTNTTAPFAPEAAERWLPVNIYVGGAEHAVLHLLYARFITKVLADIGVVGFREPFHVLRNVGLILATDGQKMSKSRGNVVNPDEVIDAYGADSLRLYEMFMGPFEDAKPWSTDSIGGVRRFLDRMWQFGEHLRAAAAGSGSTEQKDDVLRLITARTIKKVTSDIESFRFNTAIAAMMELLNVLYEKKKNVTPAVASSFRALLLLLQPFAPHLTAELWERGKFGTAVIWTEPWPTYDEADLIENSSNVAVQVNGKLRGTVSVARAVTDEELEMAAKQQPNVALWLAGKTIKKVIVRSGKLVNFVVGE